MMRNNERYSIEDGILVLFDVLKHVLLHVIDKFEGSVSSFRFVAISIVPLPSFQIFDDLTERSSFTDLNTEEIICFTKGAV